MSISVNFSPESSNVISDVITIYEDNELGRIAQQIKVKGSGRIGLRAKVFLEGPFNGVYMENNQIMENLPLSQPYYGEPWNYMGNESVTGIPNNNVVDWFF